MIKKSNILAFDTSTAMCTVALMVRGEIFSCEEILEQRHAERILPMIEDLLAQAKISLSDLDAIAFGCGPGSFIGVRIATGVVQSLAFAQDLPVIPVSSLQALAQNAFKKTGAKKIAAGWDARMEAIYWGLFEERNGFMESIKPEALSKPEDIQISSDFIAVGNAWFAYQNKLSKEFHPLKLEEELYPNAISILEIALEKFSQGLSVSPLQAEPVYLRDDVAKKSVK